MTQSRLRIKRSPQTAMQKPIPSCEKPGARPGFCGRSGVIDQRRATGWAGAPAACGPMPSRW
jgi:hypothetical protein